MKDKPNLIVIAGMPGSGKTNLIRTMREVRPDLDAFDNILDAEQRSTELLNRLKSGRDCVCSDVLFCDEVTMSRFIRQYYHIAHVQRIYFTNNPHQCGNNARVRNGSQVLRQLQLIRQLSENYLPPLTVEVWSPELAEKAK